MTDPKKTMPDIHQSLDLIELLFFAYRDFVAEPDNVLKRFGFGRAHHRVLHFVGRQPGLRVADLLNLLKITKQSLGRVLRELVAEGFIEQREGAEDRRERLLHLTPKGQTLANELVQLQVSRMASALGFDGCPAPERAAKFLFALIDPQNRGEVARLVGERRLSL